MHHGGMLPRGLKGYRRFFLDGPGGAKTNVGVESWRTGGEMLLVRFSGIADRDGAASLTGRTLYVPREDMPKLKPGEYYHVDLLGAAVVDEEGGALATVEDVKPWGEYDMLFLRTGGKSWMLPVIEAYVLDISAEEKRITVRVPEGLGP